MPQIQSGGKALLMKIFRQDMLVAQMPIGLFTGLSGLGYLCLRISHPELVPCVLSFNVLP
jgi:lantibiotic modifying enzyme